MKKINLFVIFIAFLFSTSLCYANNFNLNIEYQGLLTTADDTKLISDWRASFKSDWTWLNLTVGKEKLIWGVAQTGTLSLSPSSPPIPLIQYRIILPMVEYYRFISPLELDRTRWLFGHRLEGKFSKLNVGFWELMLCSNEIFGGYFIPIPIFPLYAMQYFGKMFNNVYDKNSNVMLGIDFQYKIFDSTEIYGELLIDDFPQKAEFNNPRKVGGVFGIKYGLSNKTDIWGEYVRINNFVYTHRNESNRFLCFEQPFGHWLGMDGDLWALGINQIINEDTKIYWQIHRINKGEGDFKDNWVPDYNNDYEFLTGIVEKSYQFNIKAEHSVTENLQLIMSTILGQSHNTDHIKNLVTNYLEFKFGIKLHFNYLTFLRK